MNNQLEPNISLNLSEEIGENSGTQDHVFTRPDEATKEGETEMSDSSLLSSASVGSEAPQSRKRRRHNSKPWTETALDEVSDTAATRHNLPSFEEVQKDLKSQSTADIGAHILECMSTVEMVAGTSRNLKRTFVHTLRVMACTVKAATEELTQRISTIPEATKLRKENGELRSKLTVLESKVNSLNKEMSTLRRERVAPVTQKGRADGSHQQTDPLVQQITAIVDRRLADFRAEIFPGRAIRPPLGKKETSTKKHETAGNYVQRKAAELPQPSTSGVQVPVAFPEWPVPTPWSTVVGRKVKSKAKSKSKPKPTLSASQRQQAGTLNDRGTLQRRNKTATPREPKNAAVSITLVENSQVGLGEVMAAARQRLSLSECGITALRQKKAVTGGLLLEIPGPESAAKADTLAGRLRDALSDMGVKISRPVKTGEIRVMDLDESITQQEVAAAVAEAGGCREDDVKVGYIKLNPSRMGTVWVRCPLAAVRKLAGEGRVRVGWVSARIQVLRARKLQCYRCLEVGHVRQQCTNSIDRSSCCYCCGETGHKARECTARIPKCLVCAHLGLPADHRLGGVKCTPPKKKRSPAGVQAPWDTQREATQTSPAKPPELEIMETQNSQDFGFSKAT